MVRSLEEALKALGSQVAARAGTPGGKPRAKMMLPQGDPLAARCPPPTRISDELSCPACGLRWSRDEPVPACPVGRTRG